MASPSLGVPLRKRLVASNVSALARFTAFAAFGVTPPRRSGSGSSHEVNNDTCTVAERPVPRKSRCGKERVVQQAMRLELGQRGSVCFEYFQGRAGDEKVYHHANGGDDDEAKSRC